MGIYQDRWLPIIEKWLDCGRELENPRAKEMK